MPDTLIKRGIAADKGPMKDDTDNQSRQATKARADLKLLVALAIAFSTIAYLLDLQLPQQITGLAGLSVIWLCILLAWYSWRRTREIRTVQATNTAKMAGPGKYDLQPIFDATPYGMVIIDLQKKIRYANNAALTAMGYENISDVEGKLCHKSLCPAQANKCPILDLGQSVDRSEKILVYKDGTRIPILKSVVPFEFNGEKLLLEAFIDISDRKKSEAFIRDILQSVDEAFVVLDRDYKIMSVNRAYCDQVKQRQDDILGKRCFEVSHGYTRHCREEGEACPVEITFKTGLPHTTIHVHHDSYGNSLYVETKSYPLKDASGQITAAIEIINDITDKRRLEEQLRHSQKMEAIGTLTGGVAHEFNNIITAIMGFGEFLQEKLEPNSELRRYADYITSSAHRAARLTEGLMAYSRKQITHMQPMDINEAIIKIESFLRSMAGDKIRLTFALAETPVVAQADRSQFEQAIMNLSTNAVEAMPDGGELTIATSQVDYKEPEMLNQATVRPGSYVLITLTDTGVGISKTTLPKIFEPFFTTKDVGKGTGLGLAMVYGIIRKHKGYITVESEPGKGTTFSIYLPVSRAKKRTAEMEPHSHDSRGPRTILIAEDDASVRELLEHAIKASGYNVISARNGREALDIHRSSGQEIDLLLFDVSMPVMDGLEAYREIKTHNPEVMVIFISGYFSQDEQAIEVTLSGLPFISKPISPKDLLEKIRQVLD